MRVKATRDISANLQHQSELETEMRMMKKTISALTLGASLAAGTMLSALDEAAARIGVSEFGSARIGVELADTNHRGWIQQAKLLGEVRKEKAGNKHEGRDKHRDKEQKEKKHKDKDHKKEKDKKEKDKKDKKKKCSGKNKKKCPPAEPEKERIPGAPGSAVRS